MLTPLFFKAVLRPSGVRVNGFGDIRDTASKLCINLYIVENERQNCLSVVYNGPDSSGIKW